MTKAVAIMQPYFFPYIGYWQLMSAADQFVIYDNIQYTKKGWINRNRYLRNKGAETFTLPLKSGSDFLEVRERFLSDDFNVQGKKILRKIESAYMKAPNFEEGYCLFKSCIEYKDTNLFNFIFHSISKIKTYLGISTELVISSSINCDHSLKMEKRIQAICGALSATEYLNPTGGSELYSRDDFQSRGIELLFQKVGPVIYQQFDGNFVPGLSILDLIMFNKPEDGSQRFLKNCEFY